MYAVIDALDCFQRGLRFSSPLVKHRFLIESNARKAYEYNGRNRVDKSIIHENKQESILAQPVQLCHVQALDSKIEPCGAGTVLPGRRHGKMPDYSEYL